MIPLFLIILLVPFVTHLQMTHAQWGDSYDVLFFWKDKTLWVLSFLALFSIRRRLPSPIVLFLGFLLFATIHSPDLYLSMWGMPNYSEGAVSFLCYCILFTVAADFPDLMFEEAASLAVYGMGFLAVIQLLFKNYLLFPPIHYLSGLSGATLSSYGRLPFYMSLANPNHLGLFCALLFPYFIRVPNYYAAGILAALSAGCGSRASWIAILLTLPLKAWRWVGPSLLVLVICFYPVILPRLFTWGGSDRFFIWENTLPLINLLGHGPATFILDFPQKLVETVNLWPKGTLVDRPHNMYLQIAHAMGVLSLIPLGWIVCKSIRKESIYRYGVLGFLICGLFTDSMVGVSPLFCIMIGMNYECD
jgi:hypothetical protein